MNKRFAIAIALMIVGGILLAGFNVALAIGNGNGAAIGMTVTFGILGFVLLIAGLIWSIVELFVNKKDK